LGEKSRGKKPAFALSGSRPLTQEEGERKTKRLWPHKRCRCPADRTLAQRLKYQKKKRRIVREKRKSFDRKI